MLAVLWLRLKGYRIAGRRLRAGHLGEIDILAVRGETLVVVEVKCRRSLREGLEALGPRQAGRLVRAGELMLARKGPGLGVRFLRFDLVVVSTSGLPRHLPDAWRA